MALKDQRKKLLEHISKHKTYLAKNAEKLSVFRGKLLPVIDNIMKNSVAEQYYSQIKDRLIPINIMPRYIQKVATTYSEAPQRISGDNQDTVDFYVDSFSMNVKGVIADEYANLFKGYAFKPFINSLGKPDLRVLPYDRFLPYSENRVNPDEEEIFIEFMGKNAAGKEFYFTYTDLEFDAFDEEGATLDEYLLENQGVNPIGTIPFVYGKREYGELIPTQDTDLMSMTTMIPITVSDCAGALMFQAFSIIYGINVDNANLKFAPNVFWSFKQDSDLNGTPSIGTISPNVDSDKVMSFVINNFVLWLETKGIRVGSIGSMDAGSMASGISKIIDEMDVNEIKKRSIKYFEHDEEELWQKMGKIHNYWIKIGAVKNMPPAKESGLGVVVAFPEPEPMQSRAQLLADIEKELSLGTMDKEDAIRLLHPDWEEEKVLKVAGQSVESSINELKNNQVKENGV